MKSKHLATFAALGLSSMLSGCAVFSSQDSPVIEDKLGKDTGVRTLALRADRRLVLARVDGCATNRLTRIIAEPSPDVMQNVASLLSASVKADTKEIGDVQLSLLTSATREVARLGTRSQGVILFRDASYRWAEAYLNGAISPSELNAGLTKLVEQAAKLIEAELKVNPMLSRPLVESFTNHPPRLAE